MLFRSLALSKATDYFVPIQASDSESFRVKGSSLKNYISRQFGLSTNDLTLAGIKKFLSDQEVKDPILSGLINDPKLSEKVKVSMLIHQLSISDRPELFSSFKLRFSDFIVKRPLPPMEIVALEKWAKAIIRSRSAQDIYALIESAPKDVHPYHLLTTWEQVIIGELARGNQLDYKQMRNIAKRFQFFRIKKEIQLEELESEKIISELGEYFKSAMAGPKSCFRTQSEIIRSLL